MNNIYEPSPNARFQLPASLPPSDRRFLSDLCETLRLAITYDEFDENDRALITISFDKEMLEMTRPEDSEDEEAIKNGEAEWQRAILRVLKKYEKSETAKEDDDEMEAEFAKEVEDRMAKWKNDYYKVC